MDEWGALHEGADRERFDAPGRFDLANVRMPARHARPARRAARFVHRRLVRPYARTGGRTTPAQELALESLVSTSERGRRHEGTVSAAQRFICDLCVDEHSVAEVAAYSRLPLAVVKVLVEDLAEAGAVRVHPPGFVLGDRPAREFMERILAGLQRL